MCIASSAHSQHAASRLGHLPADRQDDAMDGTAAANRPAHYNPNELLYVIFGICVVVYISSYLICSKDLTNRALPEDAADAPPPTDAPDAATPAPPPADDAGRVKHAPPPPPPPPTTPASHRITHILPAALAAYAIDRAGCWPADVDNPAKHRLPPPPPRAARGAEPKSAMVVYIAVALLLMSLAATLVDFCKAKSELTTNANQLHASRKKPALTRRCSLADLTVLRHTRKELLRKESFCAAGERDWKITRPPLRFD